jgi:hypothetical protein
VSKESNEVSDEKESSRETLTIQEFLVFFCSLGVGGIVGGTFVSH